MRLSSLRRPFVCLVVSEASPKKAVRVMDAYESRVDAFEVNLTLLEERSFRDVFCSTVRPCLATNRRPGFMRFYGYHDLPPVSEEDRATRLLAALGAGATAIDCELDMFDDARQSVKPPYLSEEEKAYARSSSDPAELSRDRGCVAKQLKLVRRAKDSGGEVVLSCHSQTVIDRSHGSTIMSAMERRGADFGKIVSLTLEARDLVPFIETVLLLRNRSKIPYNLMNVGSESILGRLLSVKLGSSWIYCRPDSGTGYGGQPSIGQVRTFVDMVGR